MGEWDGNHTTNQKIQKSIIAWIQYSTAVPVNLILLTYMTFLEVVFS